MQTLSIGDVIVLPIGLKCFHHQSNSLVVLEHEKTVVITNARFFPADFKNQLRARFEDSKIIEAKELANQCDWNPNGCVYTFAQYGDIRDEFIIPDKPDMVLRKMQRGYFSV